MGAVADNDIVSPENTKTHHEMATYGKTPQNKIVPKLINNRRDLLSTAKLAHAKVEYIGLS